MPSKQWYPTSLVPPAVGTLPQGYIRNVPLPRVPRVQSATSHITVPMIPIPDYYATPYVVPTCVSPAEKKNIF